MLSKEEFLRNRKEKENKALEDLIERTFKRVSGELEKGRTTINSIPNEPNVQQYLRHRLEALGWVVEFHIKEIEQATGGNTLYKRQSVTLKLS